MTYQSNIYQSALKVAHAMADGLTVLSTHSLKMACPPNHHMHTKEMAVRMAKIKSVKQKI